MNDLERLGERVIHVGLRQDALEVALEKLRGDLPSPGQLYSRLQKIEDSVDRVDAHWFERSKVVDSRLRDIETRLQGSPADCESKDAIVLAPPSMAPEMVKESVILHIPGEASPGQFQQLVLLERGIYQDNWGRAYSWQGIQSRYRPDGWIYATVLYDLITTRFRFIVPGDGN